MDPPPPRVFFTFPEMTNPNMFFVHIPVDCKRDGRTLSPDIVVMRMFQLKDKVILPVHTNLGITLRIQDTRFLSFLLSSLKPPQQPERVLLQCIRILQRHSPWMWCSTGDSFYRSHLHPQGLNLCWCLRKCYFICASLSVDWNQFNPRRTLAR